MGIIKRNKSREFLDNPSKLTKNFTGIDYIQQLDDNKMNLIMIPKSDKVDKNIIAQRNEVKRVLMLFGYNGLNNEDLINHKEFKPIPLTI